MKRRSILTIALFSAASLFSNSVLAGPYDALSENEISEMLIGDEAPSANYSNATPEPSEPVVKASEEDDEVESELGQNGATDALHESARAEEPSRFDAPTPIPAAKSESWMKKSSHSKKKITKVVKKHHQKMKKAKKYSKKATIKKGKHIAAAKGKKKYSINKKRFARR